MLMFIRYLLLAQAFSKDNHNQPPSGKSQELPRYPQTAEKTYIRSPVLWTVHVWDNVPHASATNAANLELQRHISEAGFALPIIMLFILPRSFAASLCSTPWIWCAAKSNRSR